MDWLTINRTSKPKTRYAKFSICNSYRKSKLLNKKIEKFIELIPLEDLIAIKLELSTRKTGGFLYNLNFLSSVSKISHEAILKFVLSSCSNFSEAALMLGTDRLTLKKMIKKYNIEEQLKE